MFFRKSISYITEFTNMHDPHFSGGLEELLSADQKISVSGWSEPSLEISGPEEVGQIQYLPICALYVHWKKILYTIHDMTKNNLRSTFNARIGNDSCKFIFLTSAAILGTNAGIEVYQNPIR